MKFYALALGNKTPSFLASTNYNADVSIIKALYNVSPSIVAPWVSRFLVKLIASQASICLSF